MNDQVFAIRSREDAIRAMKIMHSLYAYKDKDPDALRIYEVFEQLLDYFESQQVKTLEYSPGEIIREILIGRGISQREFAKMIGTSETSLSAMINGGRSISEKRARKIAKILNIDKQIILQRSNAA